MGIRWILRRLGGEHILQAARAMVRKVVPLLAFQWAGVVLHRQCISITNEQHVMLRSIKRPATELGEVRILNVSIACEKVNTPATHLPRASRWLKMNFQVSGRYHRHQLVDHKGIMRSIVAGSRAKQGTALQCTRSPKAMPVPQTHITFELYWKGKIPPMQLGPMVSVKFGTLRSTCEVGDCCCIQSRPTRLPKTVAVCRTRIGRNIHWFSFWEIGDDPKIEWSLGRVKIGLKVTL